MATDPNDSRTTALLTALQDLLDWMIVKGWDGSMSWITATEKAAAALADAKREDS